ncbi:hypothetical protein V5F44_08745 [Xanthobacter sp. V2C-8]|uniref:hypothetical protein n=1 Tax=Xanthobacter albus TaxID=3119929 RepID=UPI003729458A
MTATSKRLYFRRGCVEGRFAAFNGAYVLLLLISALASAAIAVVYAKWSAGRDGTPASELFLPFLSVAAIPESTERFTFLAVSLLVSVLALLAAAFQPPALPRRMMAFSAPLNACIYFTLAVLVFWGLSELDFGRSLWVNAGAPPGPVLLRLGGCAVVAACCVMAEAIWPRRHLLPRSAAGVVVLAVFATAVGLQILSWRIVSEASITPDGVWSIHADALVYVIHQVSAGKMLLVDLPSQYGFYAEFLAVIFKVFNFSIYNMSIIFVFMQIISLFCILFVLYNSVSYFLFRAVSGLAIIFMTFLTVSYVVELREFYFQYWPIRFLWPAVSVLCFWLYQSSPNQRRAALVSLVGAVGAVWNADTGLMIVGAFTSFLLAKWVVLRARGCAGDVVARRHLLKALALQWAIFAAVMGAGALYLIWRSDQAIHWEWLVRYQRLFYDYGLAMLPLPLGPANPWMTVLAVYLLGALSAMARWRRAPRARGADLVFFVSVLGWGLFVYYQGRSHILNLITVCWPALLVATILADRVVRAVEAGALGRIHLVLPVTTLAVLFYCALPFVSNLGMFWRDARNTLLGPKRIASELVAEELAFIRAHSTPGEECLVLSLRQGLYTALAGLRTPTHGPGYVEMLTIEDRDDFLRQLHAHRFGCVFIGLGAQTAMNLGVDLMEPFQDYEKVATSGRGTLIRLRPREP